MVNDTTIRELNRGKATSGGVGLSAILYVIYASYYISGYSSQAHNYVLMGLFGLWIVAAIFESPQRFNKSLNNSTAIWVTFFLLYYYLMSLPYGYARNTSVYIAKYLMLFFCVLQFKYYQEKNSRKEIKFIVMSLIAVWTFFAIKAIIFYTSNPSAGRTLAADFYAFDSIAIGGGYAIAFGSAILCVYLFECIINKTVNSSLKFVFTILVIILYYLLIKTESTLTLMACSVGMIASLVRRMWRNGKKDNTVAKVFVTALLLGAFVMIFFNIREIGEWLVGITRTGVDNVILRRFNRVGEKMQYFGTGQTSNNYVDERFSYISLSWRTFLQHPLIGVGINTGNIFGDLKAAGVGMHSAVCDTLAQHGIFGTIFYAMFFVKALKNECSVYYNTYIITLLFMVLFNPFGYFHGFCALFLIIPMLDIYIYKIQRLKEIV